MACKRCTRRPQASKQLGGAGRWIRLKGRQCGKIVSPTEYRTALKTLLLEINPVEGHAVIKTWLKLTMNHVLIYNPIISLMLEITIPDLIPKHAEGVKVNLG